MIEDLKFQKLNVKFDDNQKAMYAHKKGKFSRQIVKSTLQNMSDELHDAKKQATVGCAMHYKNINKWVPALMTKVGAPVLIFDPNDSPDSVDAYKNDSIDSVMFYVINNADGKYNHITHKKPGTKQFVKQKIDKSIFKV